MNKNHFILVLFFLTLINCKKSNTNKKSKETAIIEILQKEYNFGTIKVGDTVNHDFYIKNISNQNLKIGKIGTSCGCTNVSEIDSVVQKGEKTKVTIQFIAQKEQIGEISNSAVVEMNTKPPFTIFRLKGNVIN